MFVTKKEQVENHASEMFMPQLIYYSSAQMLVIKLLFAPITRWVYQEFCKFSVSSEIETSSDYNWVEVGGRYNYCIK